MGVLMNFEYQMLAILTVGFILAWMPSSLGKLKSYGLKWVASNRDPVKGSELLPWAGRAERAYANLKDYYPGFAVAIILLGILGRFDQGTQYAAGIYVVSRLAHFVVYLAGWSAPRTVAFLTGLVANLYLLGKILF